MEAIRDAIIAGAPAEDLAALPLPESFRAVFVSKEEAGMFEGLASLEKDPRKSLHVDEVAVPELAGRVLYRRHGLGDQLQHRLDLDL